MADKKYNLSIANYIIGVLSIGFAFLQPLTGLTIAIIGLTQCRKQKDTLAKKARTLNIIGIILNIIAFVLWITLTIYLASKSMNGGFPL